MSATQHSYDEEEIGTRPAGVKNVIKKTIARRRRHG